MDLAMTREALDRGAALTGFSLGMPDALGVPNGRAGKLRHISLRT